MRMSMLRGFGATEAELANCRQVVELSPGSSEAKACQAMLDAAASSSTLLRTPTRGATDRNLIVSATTGVEEKVIDWGVRDRLIRSSVDTIYSPTTTVAPAPIVTVEAPLDRTGVKTTIAPPPVKVVDTSTSAPPPASKEAAPEDPTVKDEPPSIEPEKKTTIKAPPVIVVDSDTSSQINRGGGGGSVYPADAEATEEDITAGGGQAQLVTAPSSFWSFGNLKWPLGLLVGGLALFVVVPRLLKRPKKRFAGFKRRYRGLIPEDALDGR